jgi:hypothetical protein
MCPVTCTNAASIQQTMHIKPLLSSTSSRTCSTVQLSVSDFAAALHSNACTAASSTLQASVYANYHELLHLLGPADAPFMTIAKLALLKPLAAIFTFTSK